METPADEDFLKKRTRVCISSVVADIFHAAPGIRPCGRVHPLRQGQALARRRRRASVSTMPRPASIRA